MRAEIHDTYPNFQTLAAHEKEGKDFKVTTRTNESKGLAIFAIHAGNIEPGTGELALELSINTKYQLYLFESLDQKDPLRLHLTSTHFDDPRALSIAKKNQRCLSLHGFQDHAQIPTACLGGANSLLQNKFFNSPHPASIQLVPCSRKLAGLSKQNIVNRCQEAGIQLELSSSFRNKILNNAEFKKDIAQWINSLFTLD